MRLNVHGVLSVIHDSLISAGVITVYEQSVSVKQISRSVNYSPFWDLCKSQWRNSSACRVCVRVVFQQLGLAWFILNISPFLSPHFLCWARISSQSVAHKGFYSSPGSRGCHGGMSRGQIIRFRWSLFLLLLQFFPQFLLPLILPYFIQSIQSMAKLSRECWACAARRDWESFDRSTSVARVPLTFMGKLSDLVMTGAVFCVIPLYQRYSAIGLWDSIVSLSYREQCSHSMGEFNCSSNGWFQELHFRERWYWIFVSGFDSNSMTKNLVCIYIYI